MKKIFLWLPLLLLAAAGSVSAQVQSLDIDGYSNLYAQQKQTAWCWAACNQMLLNAVGIPQSQEDQVQKAFGAIINRGAGGDFEVSARALRGSYTRNDGSTVEVRPYVSYIGTNNPNDVFVIINHIKNGIPIIMATRQHGMLCIGIDYVQSPNNVQITAFRLLDPFSGSSDVVTISIQDWVHTGMGFMTIN